jgi:hypothetical protein
MGVTGELVAAALARPADAPAESLAARRAQASAV